MRIKTLEVAGFKSFVDRTVIHFEKGITGIVGPNGCGKSNVVDALLWVMGEQSAKHLRGENMEDVIFNGSDARPAMGMASVFLTFDNSDGRAPAQYADYTEITIGRRLYRSGESEYFINKTPCRLKDIVDLFLGTGIGRKAYSIVEQGRIGQIVSAKPEVRRAIIEEAAGISKFKSRKEAALRQMESTKANLLRLTDIISELNRQIGSLERQVRKAERYRELFDKVRGLDLSLAAHRWREMAEKIETMEAELAKVSGDEVSHASAVSQAETDIEQMRLAISEVEQAFSKAQEELYQVQNHIQVLEADLAYKEKTVVDLTHRNDASALEIESLNQRIAQLTHEVEEANTSKVESDMALATASEQAEAMQASYDEINDRHREGMRQSEHAQRELMEMIRQMTQSHAAIERFEQKTIDLQGLIAKNQTEIDAIDEKTSKATELVTKMEGELSGLEQMRLTIGEEHESSAATLKAQEGELHQLEEELGTLKNQLGSKSHRLNSLLELKKNYEGYKEGVRSVLKWREEKQVQGIYGTVSEMMSASPDVETAVGAVLGERLQYVVVNSHEAGREGVGYLREVAAGRGSFIPMTMSHAEAASKVTPTGEGVVGPLLDQVRFHDDAAQIGKYLLGDVVLVEDLASALRLWTDHPRSHTFVTRQGEVVDHAGVLTGGNGEDAARAFLAQKREVEELTETTAKLKTEVAVREDRRVALRSRIGQLKEALDMLAQNRHAEDIRVVQKENQVAQYKGDLERYQRDRDRLAVAIANYSEDLTRAKTEVEKARENSAAAEEKKSQLETMLADYRASETQLRAELTDVSNQLTEWKMELAQCEERNSSLDRELERHMQLLDESRAQVTRRMNEVTSATEQIAQLKHEQVDGKARLNQLIESVQTLQARVTEVKSRYDEMSNALREQELALRDRRKQSDTAKSALHGLEMQLVSLKDKQDYLLHDIMNRYKVDMAVSVDHYEMPTDMTLEQVETDVSSLREKLDKIGSVNLDAIGEYEELKKRHEFLSRQYEDLTASLDSLNRAIQKINRTSRQRFKETFEAVNERFQKLFPRLFRGGRAELIMTDMENILESGIEIVAQPPGKKLQSVSLLSGGEKALTAVAMIFSIFLIKPSPFCLLDEVDAPLDDANIDRFNELIREMTDRSQFIVITHNKRTMEMTDVLYGVTMEEAGASKIVSVRLDENKSDTAAA